MWLWAAWSAGWQPCRGQLKLDEHCGPFQPHEYGIVRLDGLIECTCYNIWLKKNHLDWLLLPAWTWILSLSLAEGAGFHRQCHAQAKWGSAHICAVSHTASCWWCLECPHRIQWCCFPEKPQWVVLPPTHPHPLGVHWPMSVCTARAATGVVPNLFLYVLLKT